MKDNGVVQFLRGNVLSSACPSRDIMKHVTSRWAVLIFIVLKDGDNHRFSEIRRSIDGVSEKMLSQTLKQLEGDGFIERTAFPVVPPHVEYKLTPFGHSISVRVLSIVEWLETNLVDILDSKAS
jgi:DNA-binding HxlR family transcriptional regulator